jgi:hypothetical protein
MSLSWLLVSIQALNGTLSRSILLIRTHSDFWQSCGKVIIYSVVTLFIAGSILAANNPIVEHTRFVPRPMRVGTTIVETFWLAVSQKADYLRILQPVSLRASVVNAEPMWIPTVCPKTAIGGLTHFFQGLRFPKGGLRPPVTGKIICVS